MTAIARSDNIKGFTLIDDDGTRYTYGKDENAIEFSIPVVNQMNSGVVATAWYLTKIEYIDGKCATFRYKRVEYDFQLQLTDATEYSSIGNKQAYFGVSSGEYGGSLIFPVYPSSFSFGGCTLSFSFDGTSSNKRQLQPDYYHAFDKNLGIKHFPVLSDALNDDGNRFSNSQAIDSLVAVRPLRRILFGGNKGTYNWEFEYSNNSSQRLTLQKMKAAAYNGTPTRRNVYILLNTSLLKDCRNTTPDSLTSGDITTGLRQIYIFLTLGLLIHNWLLTDRCRKLFIPPGGIHGLNMKATVIQNR